MAGMEQLEIHSKSYLVRWVNVAGGHSISWSIKPHKKSINFGLFKHPGAGASLTPSLNSSSTLEVPTPNPEASGRRMSSSRNDSSTAVEKLKSIGLVTVTWYGKCEAEKVFTGKHDVPADQGGMYALVFDNTFSKQFAKTATFALLTYPTSAPPSSSHHNHYFQAGAAAISSTTSLGSKPSPQLVPQLVASTDSLHDHSDRRSRAESSVGRPDTGDSQTYSPSGFYTGILQKRRRKRHQGFARRFFSLDFTSSTLSYYHNKESSALRGAIPLSLAAISANEKDREISVDSGAEVWHLRAGNQKEFDGWRNALEKASRTASNILHTSKPSTLKTSGLLSTEVNIAERDWAKVETLIGRVAGTRDAVKRLVLGQDLKRGPTLAGLGIGSNSPAESPTEMQGTDYFKDKERKPFWKRKAANGPASPSLFQRNVSSQLTPPGLETNTTVTGGRAYQNSDEDVQAHCVAILRDLDSVVADFALLVGESKRRRLPVPVSAVSAVSRHSLDSNSDQEFFDAEGGETSTMRDSQLLVLNRDSDEDVPKAEEEYFSDDDSASNSDAEGAESFGVGSTDKGTESLFPPKAKSLGPLPLDRVRRRGTVPAATVLPPSLIGFLRKNVGKDLSTISMPVSANEPLSLLQRVSEQMEYTNLLDSAINANPDTGERLLYIAAFAVSTFSNSRVKERALRKPFNPMLGETFELVREDKGFRFIAEKVSHRPVRMACQAEAKDWTLTQSPMPTQKFWGKSVELNTEGRHRIVLHPTGDRYSWTGATCFLRNIIAGEKYVEPVGTMTVVNETSGQKAAVTFKAKGMFSGRSEEVEVQAFDSHGDTLPLALAGKWTASLSLIETGTGAEVKPNLWSVGDLVDNAPARYGFTSFAAALNEVTAAEKGRIPPTDSRLRPDQRAAEQGNLERAEDLKARLEEAQRRRRKEMEERGEEWVPKWFVKAETQEEEWRYKSGKGSYWEERAKGSGWGGLVNVFEI